MSVTDGIKMVKALAADFEAAWKEEADLPDDCSNEQMDAAIDRTKVFVNRILCLRGTDISILCLKARAFLWAEAAFLPEWFAECDGPTTDKALASLFLDLGADYPVGGVKALTPA
jgi:hypothetical protein